MAVDPSFDRKGVVFSKLVEGSTFFSLEGSDNLISIKGSSCNLELGGCLMFSKIHDCGCFDLLAPLIDGIEVAYKPDVSSCLWQFGSCALI